MACQTALRPGSTRGVLRGFERAEQTGRPRSEVATGEIILLADTKPLQVAVSSGVPVIALPSQPSDSVDTVAALEWR